MPEFYMIFAKNNKTPQFYTTIARILHNNCQQKKKYFPDFFFGGGVGRAPSLPPVSYT